MMDYTNDVHTIAVNIENYEGDTKLFWEDISRQLNILIRNDYECKFYYEDCGVYIIEYAPKDHKYGGSSCVWITTKEHEDIDYFRRNDAQEDTEDAEDEEEIFSGETRNDR